MEAKKTLGKTSGRDLTLVQGDEIKNCGTLYSSRRGSLAGTTSRPCPPPSATSGTCTGLQPLRVDPPESFVRLRDVRYWICLLSKKNQVDMFMHLHIKMVSIHNMCKIRYIFVKDTEWQMRIPKFNL